MVATEVRVARIQKERIIAQELISLAKQPIMQAVLALVIIENLQKYNLVGQNVSTALELAIVSKEVIAAAGNLGGLMPLKGLFSGGAG